MKSTGTSSMAAMAGAAGLLYLSADRARAAFAAPPPTVEVRSLQQAADVVAPQGSVSSGLGPAAACGAAGAVASTALLALAARKKGATPAGRSTRNIVTQQAFENEIGVQAPAGYWDPAGLSREGDRESFARRRAAELKHGRICMYACIGYIVPEYFRFGGELSPSEGLAFTDVPNGLGALSVVPVLGWLQIFAFCGLIEATGFFQGRQSIGFMRDATETGEPGNYGLGFLGAFNKLSYDPKDRVRKLNAELANGRLAMIAIMGLLFQNGTVGSTGADMYNLPPGEVWGAAFGLFVIFWGFFFTKEQAVKKK